VLIGATSCDEELTTPVFWDNFDYTNEKLRQCEEIIELVSERSVHFVPLFEKFSQANQAQTLLADGLHPNDKGHEFIAGVVLAKLQELT